MSTTEISPNEPDVMPDYIDDKPGKKSAATRSEMKRSAPSAEPLPQMSADEPLPDYVDADAQPASVEMSKPEASGHREGECVPNVPDIEPAFVSREEMEALSALKAARPAEEPAPAVSRWWRWHLLATVLVLGGLGVVVFSQAISAMAMAATLPQWAQYGLLIPLGISCLAVLWVGFSLFRSWMRLRAIRQIDLGALEELKRRAQSRQDGVEHFQAARSQVESYLRKYPLTVDGIDQLQRAGLSSDDIEHLAAARDFLVDRAQDSRTWLEEFRDQFQTRIDSVAAKRINSWSIRAAGCVIASPLPLLDAALVLGISLKLLKDLCAIYNVRSSRTGSLVLLNRAIFAAFVAGVAEEGTEMAGEMAMGELTGMMGESTLNSVGAKVAGFAVPKLGEGAINAFFIRRLGRAAVRLLQPVTPGTVKKKGQ